MSWSTKFSLVAAITGTIAFVMGIYQMSHPPRAQGEFIACMNFGCTYCGEVSVTECGVSLNKCADTRTYHCLHDIAIKFVP